MFTSFITVSAMVASLILYLYKFFTVSQQSISCSNPQFLEVLLYFFSSSSYKCHTYTAPRGLGMLRYMVGRHTLNCIVPELCIKIYKFDTANHFFLTKLNILSTEPHQELNLKSHTPTTRPMGNCSSSYTLSKNTFNSKDNFMNSIPATEHSTYFCIALISMN